MKKFIYSVILVSTIFFTFSSCTDEEIKPQSGTENGAGGPIKE